MIDHSIIIRGLLQTLDAGKFNSGERLAKLRNKEKSLRQIGSHEEANLFKQKIAELAGGRFNENQPRDKDGQFSESASSVSRNEAKEPKASPSNLSKKEKGDMDFALKADGFQQSEFSRGIFTAKRPDGMHSFKIDNATGDWTYYSPWDAPSVKGRGTASLKSFLSKGSATDSYSPFHYPRQEDGKFGPGGSMKPHKKEGTMKKKVKDVKPAAKAKSQHAVIKKMLRAIKKPS